MNPSDSETAEDSPIFKNVSLDSGISEDMKESSESAQCSSKINKKAKSIKAKTNMDKILQLPISSSKKKHKKSELKDGVSGSSANFTSQEYLDKMSILQQLREEEKQLKIAIACEKLRKEQPVFLDTDILHEKIAEHQKLVQEARNENKMKNVMCINLQMANTLQRIIGRTKAIHKQNSFSDTQRKCVEELLKKKKELNKRIGAKRKEIAEIDEEILELEKIVITNKQKKRKLVADHGMTNSNTEMGNLTELERLQENNEKVAERVHLLSGIIQSLIPQVGSSWQEEPDLLDLMAECEDVSKSKFEDLDDIYARLTSVCSVIL